MKSHFNETVDRRQDDLADVESFAARWTEQAWRLAVVIHAASHGKQAHHKQVQCVDSAIEIADWFSEQQLALLAQTRAVTAENREKRVMELLRAQVAKCESKVWLTARDLQMNRVVTSSAEAKQLLQNMEKLGKLSCETNKPRRGGHAEVRYFGKQ